MTSETNQGQCQINGISSYIETRGRFDVLCEQVGEWSRRNFGSEGGLNEIAPLMGVGEEILNEANVASSFEQFADAYCDALIFLADFCYRCGIRRVDNLFFGQSAINEEYNRRYHSVAANTVLPGTGLHIAYGECLRHCLKRKQGIREYSSESYFLSQIRKSVSELFWCICAVYEFERRIYTHNIPQVDEFDCLADVLGKTWAEVSKRDWRANPDNAHKVAEEITTADPPLGEGKNE